jgi:hypothetical protein
VDTLSAEVQGHAAAGPGREMTGLRDFPRRCFPPG